MLKRSVDASPEELRNAEQTVASTCAELEKANKLPIIAEQYRLLINHEISRVRSGKRSPLGIDEDESARTGQLRIYTARFQEWLEGMELDDTNEIPVPIAIPVDEDAFSKPLGSKAAESLHLTLGLLVSLYAKSRGGKFGTSQKPNVINIATEIDGYAKELNDGHALLGQQTQAIRKRIELALNALKSYI
jgi:hypothetical protein